MTDKDDSETSGDSPGQRSASAAALGAVAKHAHEAMESARELAAGANLDEIGARAAETASNLYRGGRDLIADNEDLSRAADNLSVAVRKNPLAAVGVAFSAGLLLALLFRG